MTFSVYVTIVSVMYLITRLTSFFWFCFKDTKNYPTSLIKNRL